MGVFWDRSTCSPFQPSQDNLHWKDRSLGAALVAAPIGGALVSTVTRTCSFNRCGPASGSDTLFEGVGVTTWKASEARTWAGVKVPARAAKTSNRRSLDALVLVGEMSLLRITAYLRHPVAPQHLRFLACPLHFCQSLFHRCGRDKRSGRLVPCREESLNGHDDLPEKFTYVCVFVIHYSSLGPLLRKAAWRFLACGRSPSCWRADVCRWCF